MGYTPLEMSPLEFQQSRGRRKRHEILAELRRRDREGEGYVPLRDLSAALGYPVTTISRHVSVLRDAGLVETALGRSGGVRITDAGRLSG